MSTNFSTYNAYISFFPASPVDSSQMEKNKTMQTTKVARRASLWRVTGSYFSLYIFLAINHLGLKHSMSLYHSPALQNREPCVRGTRMRWMSQSSREIKHFSRTNFSRTATLAQSPSPPWLHSRASFNFQANILRRSSYYARQRLHSRLFPPAWVIRARCERFAWTRFSCAETFWRGSSRTLSENK